MNKYIHCIVLFTFAAVVAGQAQPLKDFISAADTAFAKKDFYPALKYYEIALEFDSNRTDLWYKYAESARQFNAFTYADTAYQKVLTSVEKNNFPLTTYWLADVRQRLGSYESAKATYQAFLESNPSVPSSYKERAKIGIDDCDWAINAKENKWELNIQQLDTTVNSSYSEFGATLDGNTLYYSSFQFLDKKDKHNPPREYFKLMQANNGEGGILLSEEINEPGKLVGHPAFNDKRDRVFYTKCEYVDVTTIRCDIYASEIQNNLWSPSYRLPINVDGFTTTQPNYGKDPNTGQEVLYFASDRTGGQGMLDLWFALIKEDGSFGEAVNLTDINTKNNEATPFYHELSNKLYFSSDGYQGFGGYDIYSSQLENDIWSTPRPMNYPLNSSYDDQYYYVSPSERKVYFSSNRIGSQYLEEAKEACCNDIYRIDIKLEVNLLATTFNNLSKEELEGVTINFYEIIDDQEQLVSTITNPTSNDFEFPVELYKKYKLKASRRDFIEVESILDLSPEALEHKYGPEFDLVLGAESPSLEKGIEEKLFLDPLQVELQVLTINANNNNKLNGCSVVLKELKDGAPMVVDSQRNESNNQFLFPLSLNKTYLLSASKPGFEPRSITRTFTQEDVDTLGGQVTVTIPLKRVSFDDFLPLALFFDNDFPNPNSVLTTTDVAYMDTYNNYYQKKDEFISEFTKELSDNEKFVIGQQYNDFFEREVRGGNRNLELFTEQLLRFLEEGNSLNIEIKGFASPRASDDYNQRLSQRRIQALKNHFYSFGEGEFRPYLESNALRIEESAFGESTAGASVPYDLQDLRGSVYSVIASAERRVEIIEVNTDQE